jgi:hypothetical protein
MSAELDERFEDWATWYINNVLRISIVDPKRQWEFMTTAMAGLIELFDALRQDLKAMEGRQSHLYRPSSVKITGDLTRLG